MFTRVLPFQKLLNNTSIPFTIPRNTRLFSKTASRYDYQGTLPKTRNIKNSRPKKVSAPSFTSNITFEDISHEVDDELSLSSARLRNQKLMEEEIIRYKNKEITERQKLIKKSDEPEFPIPEDLKEFAKTITAPVVEKGSSKKSAYSDNLDQIELHVIEARKAGDIVVFVDGASKNNPGPCGSGISIEIPMKSFEEIKQNLNNLENQFVSQIDNPDAIRLDFSLAYGYGTNNHCEIKAIENTILILSNLNDLINANSVNLQNRKVYIYSDSNWALNIVSGEWKANEVYKPIADQIRGMIDVYKTKYDAEIILSWVKAHATCRGNIIADRLASQAALVSAAITTNNETFVTPVQGDASKVSGLKYIINEDIVDVEEVF